MLVEWDGVEAKGYKPTVFEYSLMGLLSREFEGCEIFAVLRKYIMKEKEERWNVESPEDGLVGLWLKRFKTVGYAHISF